MMTREELEAALAYFDSPHFPRSLLVASEFLAVLEAARKQLALMPEKCGTCGGSRWVDGGHRGATTSEVCPTCHGSGKVYPQTLIERVLLALPFYLSEVQLVAVLDALGETE